MIYQHIILLSSLALLSPVRATNDQNAVCHDVDEFIIPRELIEIESTDHDAVYRWLLDYMKRIEQTNYYLKYLIDLKRSLDEDCDANFRNKTRQFLPLIEGERANSSFVQYFKYHAKMRLEECLKREDPEWSLGSKWIAEWALGRFFKAALGLGERASDSQLLKQVSKFELTSSEFDHLAAAKVVIALADFLRRSPVLYPPGSVLADWDTINWLTKGPLRDGMKRALSAVTLNNCAVRLEEFFDRKCYELERYRGMFELVDLARALGSEKLARFGSKRVLKLVEFNRVCGSWRENKNVIRSKLRADFRGTECAS